MNSTIGFAGMTHLGLVSAIGIASKEIDVCCYDANSELIEKIQEGNLPIVEPDLQMLFRNSGKRLNFSTDISILNQCDIVYVASDVPTNDAGQSDLSDIQKLIDRIVPELSDSALLIILCQVPPGFTRKINFDLDRLYYQVETLIFGRAVERTLNPERFIVGCVSPTKTLPGLYKDLLNKFECPVLPMRYESAELAKISINMCLVASVSVANTLAEICENIGADWSEILPALKLDRRIGQYSYLNPGLGISGGNLERDLVTVINLSDLHKTDAGVVRAWLANSQYRKDWVYSILKKEILANKIDIKIGVLGLAYKENTHSTKNSPSLFLLKHLIGMNVVVHDPVVQLDVAEFEFELAKTAMQVADQSDVVIVMTPWPEYKNLDLNELAESMKGNVLIDPLKVFDKDYALHAKLNYFTLGVPAYRL